MDPVKFADRIQHADWKTEKHVPVIECADQASAGEWVKVSVGLGKAAAHPNTTEHHIRWIKVFFSPDGDKYAYDIGTFEFNAHGESVKGPNEGPVHTNHEVSFTFKAGLSGTIHALAFCNIHGVWGSEKRIQIG